MQKVAALTNKQESFVGAVVAGASLTDAYRQAYNVRPVTKGKTVWEAASRLASTLKVSARLSELKAKVEVQMIESIEAQRKAVLTQLWAEATDPENPAACRVRALELLGRTGSLRLFEEQISVKADWSMPELQAELELRLLGLISGS